jgi:5-methyltetrahydropteroyltriglutamate--homocysteine methyltransferase
VPLSLLGLLPDKDVLVGAINVATKNIETPEEVAAALRAALDHVAPERLVACITGGLHQLRFRALAEGCREDKLKTPGAGAALLKKELAG